MYRLNLQLPPEVGEALKTDAEERGMTISALMRRLIAQHLAESGKPVEVKVAGWGAHPKRKKTAQKTKTS